jgi:hypothetical protein
MLTFFTYMLDCRGALHTGVGRAHAVYLMSLTLP